MNDPRARAIAVMISVIGSVCLCLNPSNAATHALGQITTRGNVAINGEAAATGMSIFSGDLIKTKDDSTAALSLSGGREIIQAERGSLTVKEVDRQISVDISVGKVAVLSPANAPVEIEARGLRIVPGAGGGVYEIQLAGQELSVTALKGYAEIIAVNRTVRVGKGMKCDAVVGASQSTLAARKNALGTPIIKFTILSAGLVSSAALAVILAEGSSNCAVSPSSTGKCQQVP